MDHLDSFLRRMNLSPQKRRPVALELSELGKLPPELILCIADFLSSDSAVAFGLCCHPIRSFLEIHPSKPLKQSSQSYYFLTLLARDLPDHVLCHHCMKFHSIEKAQRHSPYAYWQSHTRLPCWDANFRLKLYHCCGIFSFTIFQMAMKRNSQGQDSSELLPILSHDIAHHNNNPATQHKTLARIIHSSMIIREQTLVIVPLDQLSLTRESTPKRICPHARLVWGFDSETLDIIANFRLPERHVQMRGLVSPGLVRRCKYCRTDFCFETKILERKFQAIYITKWRDLGPGLSPFDNQWRMHFDQRRESLWIPEPDRGSVCSAFEGKELHWYESDSILTEGRKKLFRMTKSID